MTASRPSFIQLLREDFKNPEIKRLVCESSKACLKVGGDYTTRVFNHVPRFLPIVDHQYYAAKFQGIAKKIKNIAHTDDGYILLDGSDKSAIESFGKELIKKGCNELLNKNGNLKKELTELLDWQTIDNIQVIRVVASYMAMSIQHIHSGCPIFASTYQVSCDAFLKYCTENFVRWSEEVINNDPLLKVAIGTGIAGSLLLLFAGAAVVVKLINGNDSPSPGAQP